MTRRRWLAAAATLPLAACRGAPAAFEGRWLGSSAARGHRLRDSRAGTLPEPARQRRASVLVLGGGIAGLAAARALMQHGIDDLALLELEDSAGGNSRGHALGGQRCPLGAHYLPLPGPQAHEVSALLHELGLLRQVAGRRVADERHLCHSPQERLFIDGAWHEGLLPPAAPGSATLAQYRRFGARVQALQRELGFALPTHRAPWTAGHAALDAVTFAHWLDREGLDDARLRGHLDYACRDDYGAGLATVSAWAGLHYFASRHGFQVPGEAEPDDGGGVFTWPEGNAWLAERLAAPLQARLHTGHTVLAVDEGRHGVQVLAWNEALAQAEAWQADAVVMALPLFVAARVLAAPPPALAEAAARHRHAPWLVANLQLAAPLLDRGVGAPPSWDNVRFQPAGQSPSLGYVDAGHQGLAPRPGPTLVTAYWALPEAERPALLADDWRPWAQRVVDDLAAVHPDLPAKLARIELMRYGHAMSIPAPGVRGHLSLRALAQGSRRLQFAHADLSGYSVFEEAYTHGWRAGETLARSLAG